jgi:hypothetical protein
MRRSSFYFCGKENTLETADATVNGGQNCPHDESDAILSGAPGRN